MKHTTIYKSGARRVWLGVLLLIGAPLFSLIPVSAAAAMPADTQMAYTTSDGIVHYWDNVANTWAVESTADQASSVMIGSNGCIVYRGFATGALYYKASPDATTETQISPDNDTGEYSINKSCGTVWISTENAVWYKASPSTDPVRFTDDYAYDFVHAQVDDNGGVAWLSPDGELQYESAPGATPYVIWPADYTVSWFTMNGNGGIALSTGDYSLWYSPTLTGTLQAIEQTGDYSFGTARVADNGALVWNDSIAGMWYKATPTSDPVQVADSYTSENNEIKADGSGVLYFNWNGGLSYLPLDGSGVTVLTEDEILPNSFDIR